MRRLIIVKNKGQIIPPGYLDLATKGLQSMRLGAALKTPEGFSISQMEDHEGFVTQEQALEILDDTMTNFKDEAIVYSIIDFGGTFQKDDLQPFPLLEKEGAPHLAVFLEGDFSNFNKQGSSHTDEFFALTEELGPRLEKIFKTTGGDIKKFLDELRDPITARDIRKTFLSRGTITLLASTGEILTFADNERKGDFPWGWTSDILGYTEGAAAVEKKPGLFGKMLSTVKKPIASTESLSTTSKKIGVAPKLETKKPVTPPVDFETGKKMDTSVKAPVIQVETVMWAPPSHVTDKKALKRMYRRICGFLPANYQERPEVPITPKKLKAFAELKAAGDPSVTHLEETSKAAAETKTSAPPVKKAEDPPKKADVTKDVEPKIVKSETTLPVTTPNQVMSGEMKGSVSAWMKGKSLKALDKNCSEISDPKTIQEIENKYPSFAEQVGLGKTEDTFHWSFDDLLSLAKTYPHAAAILMFNYRNGWIKSYKTEKTVSNTPAVAPKRTTTEMFSGSRKVG